MTEKRSMEDVIRVFAKENNCLYESCDMLTNMPICNLVKVLHDEGYIHKSDVQEIVDVYNELLLQRPHRTEDDLKKDVNKMWRAIKTVAERVNVT